MLYSTVYFIEFSHPNKNLLNSLMCSRGEGPNQNFKLVIQGKLCLEKNLIGRRVGVSTKICKSIKFVFQCNDLVFLLDIHQIQ